MKEEKEYNGENIGGRINDGGREIGRMQGNNKVQERF